MTGDLFGRLYRAMSFGESHGEGLGVVVEGMPSGVSFNEKILKDFLERRRPGGELVSSRKEPDLPKILSGVFEGKFLGTPVSCIFENKDAKSEDYKNLPERRGHADGALTEKYTHTDPRGGGRSSGRETLARVAAGAFAKMALTEIAPEMKVRALTKSIYNISDDVLGEDAYFGLKATSLGFVSEKAHGQAVKLLTAAKVEGESYGGVVELRVHCPLKSLGQPVFGKIKADLAAAMLSLGAVKSFSIGDQVDLANTKGTDFHAMPISVYGGVQGGLTSGDTIKFFCEVKPTSSILDVSKKGRHDPCIVPRLLVVMESMVWMVLMDLWLQRKTEL
jgi:chorismate synthase